MRPIAIVLLGLILSHLSVFSEEKIDKPVAQNQYGFIENKGQIFDQNGNPNKDVLYLLSLPGMNIQVKKNGFSYDLYKLTQNSALSNEPEYIYVSGKEKDSYKMMNPRKKNAAQIDYHRIDVVFENLNSNVNISALDQGSGTINIYRSQISENGLHGIKHFRKIYFNEMYDGVDLELLITKENTFKYNFYVKNQEALKKIKWKYQGIEQVKINEKGDKIIFQTSLGSFDEHIPYSFFTDAIGNKTETTIFYNKLEDSFQFELKDHFSPEKTLCIDPGGGSAFWSTYGNTGDGFNFDSDLSMDLDASGNIYLFGPLGQYGYWLSKYNTSGNRVWDIPLIGGGGYGNGFSKDITFSAFDNAIYVCGGTTMLGGIATAGAHQTSYTDPGYNAQDGMVQKYDLNGNLIWGTYYGNVGYETFSSVVIDGSGNVYCGGVTSSSAGISTAGSHQPTYAGDPKGAGDAFLVKFNSSGTRQWATYYGGTETEWDGLELSCDASNNIFIMGHTESTTGIATAGAFQTGNSGPFPPESWVVGGDVFIAKFNSSGTRQWATYFGGSETEGFSGIYSILTDASGNIVFSTRASGSTGLATAGAHQTTVAECVIAKFNTSGSRIWSTYYGSFQSGIVEVRCDAISNIFFVGTTTTNTNLTTAGAYQTTTSGASGDAFAGMLNSSGVRQWGTLFGSTGYDGGYAIYPYNTTGDAYICGLTKSATGIATSGAYDETYENLYSQADAFLSKLGPGCDVNPVGTITWTGSKNNNWNDCVNWSPSVIPTFQSDVYIPNTANKPVIYSGSTASCNTLQVETDNGATLTVQGGSALNNYYSNNIVSALNCGSAIWSPNSLSSGSAYSGTLTVPYTTGNGTAYVTGPTINSTTVRGVNAFINEGTLNSGNGNITLAVSGTPTSGGTLSLPIIFAGKTCTVTKSVSGPVVTGLTTSSATFNPSTITRNQAYSGTITIPYTGGNGVAYPAGTAISSTSIPGITATLQSGTLASGSGNLVFTLTGTPTSAGNITFPISFGTQSATVTKAVTGAGCPGNMILDMTDASGDGWNGFTLLIRRNGTSLGTFTLGSGASGMTSITLSGAGTLEVSVTALGDFPEEVSYSIRTISGTTWLSKSSDHSIGVVKSASITCP